jgi:hypothetical protein
VSDFSKPGPETSRHDDVDADNAPTYAARVAEAMGTPGLTDEDIRGDVDPLSRQVGGSHYQTSRIQPVEVILDWQLDFCLGNVLKYIRRLKEKGDPIENIDKAIHYLQIARADLISRLPAVKSK